jgi:hypothetical protein
MITPFALDDSHCIAIWKNALLTKWHNGAPIGKLRKFATALGRLSADHPEGVVAVIWLVDRLPIPEAEGRDLVATMMKDHEKTLRGWYLIIEGSGFRASAARTVAATIRLMSRSAPYPWKITSTTSECIPWLVTSMAAGSTHVTSIEVEAALEEVTKAIAGVAGAQSFANAEQR